MERSRPPLIAMMLPNLRLSLDCYNPVTSRWIIWASMSLIFEIEFFLRALTNGCMCMCMCNLTISRGGDIKWELFKIHCVAGEREGRCYKNPWILIKGTRSPVGLILKHTRISRKKKKHPYRSSAPVFVECVDSSLKMVFWISSPWTATLACL